MSFAQHTCFSESSQHRFRTSKIYKCIIQTREVSAEPRLFFIYYEQGLLQAADLLHKEEELQHMKSVIAA